MAAQIMHGTCIGVDAECLTPAMKGTHSLIVCLRPILLDSAVADRIAMPARMLPRSVAMCVKVYCRVLPLTAADRTVMAASGILAAAVVHVALYLYLQLGIINLFGKADLSAVFFSIWVFFGHWHRDLVLELQFCGTIERKNFCG